MKAVDSVIEAVRASGVEFKALVSTLEILDPIHKFVLPENLLEFFRTHTSTPHASRLSLLTTERAN